MFVTLCDVTTCWCTSDSAGLETRPCHSADGGSKYVISKSRLFALVKPNWFSYMVLRDSTFLYVELLDMLRLSHRYVIEMSTLESRYWCEFVLLLYVSYTHCGQLDDTVSNVLNVNNWKYWRNILWEYVSARQPDWLENHKRSPSTTTSTYDILMDE